MLRLSSLLIFAAFLTYGLAQTTTTAEPTTTEANATTTEANATTTEAKPTTTEETKATTPEAKPTAAPVWPGYYNYPNISDVCMTFNGNMTWSVTYDNGSKTPAHVTARLSADKHIYVDDDNSDCSDATTRTFVFYFELFNDTAHPQYIAITFKNDSKSKVWNASDVTFSFNTDAYPNLNVNNPGRYDLDAASNLFQSNIDPGNYYSCGNAELKFDSAPINHTLNATLSITNLQVQAFHKKDDKGSLGAAQDCASGKGNKIVPIAVGAALAGLVIVVLIAYLIGRLKSRKQSSYEALS